ncbi:hypothetical protein ACU4GD_11115 [Cupriavidus basilensis]
MLDREVDAARAVIPRPGHYRASTKSIGDPKDIERLADILVNAERPAILYGQQVWTARGHEEAIALLKGLDIPGYFNGASRGLLPPGDPHHFDRTRTQAFANADVLIIVGTPFDFRHGLVASVSAEELTLVQIDMDLPHGWQEPRDRPWPGGRPRRHPRCGAAGRQRPPSRTTSARRGRSGWAS